MSNNKTKMNTIELGDLKFEIEEPAPLEVSGYTSNMTSPELCTKITAFLKSIFSDCKGTSLKHEQGQVKLIVWFSAAVRNNNGSIQAMVQPNTSNDGTNKWAQTFSNMNNVLTGRNKPYVLSDKAKKILQPLVSTVGNGRIDWNKLISFRDEQPQQGYFGMSNAARETLMRVSGIELDRILPLIYGKEKEVNGEIRTLTYQVKYLCDLPSQMAMPQPMFGFPTPYNVNQDGSMVPMLLQINQIDVDVMNKLAPLIGAQPQSSNAPIY